MRHAYAMTYDHLHAYDIFHFHSQNRHHRIAYNVAKMADTQIVLAMAVAVLCKGRRKRRRVREVCIREAMVIAKMGERSFPAVDGGITFRRRIRGTSFAFFSKTAPKLRLSTFNHAGNAPRT